MFRRLLRFGFCADLQRRQAAEMLRAAEELISVIFHHKLDEKNIKSEMKQCLIQNSKKKDGDKDKVSPQSIIQRYKFLILPDKINLKLKELRQQNIISQKIEQDFDKIFNPKKGIEFDKQIIQDQVNRIQGGLNEDRKFPFNLNSAVMNFVVNQLYEKKQKEPFKKKIKASRVVHIVGTPGLGKTFRFLAAKYLHDLRIPYIIKNGPPLESLFQDNFKFFYFHAVTRDVDLKKIILSQIKTDFGYVPSLLQSEQLKNNFIQFYKTVVKLYLNKNISIRVIIDQVNSLYKLSQDNRKSFLNNLVSIVLNSERPSIMISSKNNPYLSQFDPVLFTANSSENSVNHFKIILDNQITPEQRLNYSIQSLLFQLQKRGMPRQRAIEIVQKVNIHPMTQISIARIVKAVISGKESLQKNNQQIVKLINEQFKKSQSDLKIYEQNTNEALKNLKNEEGFKQKQYWAKIYCAMLYLSIKEVGQENIKSYLHVINQSTNGLKDNNNRYTKIQKMITMTIKKPEKTEQKQILQVLKDTNYFFTRFSGDKVSIFFTESIEKVEQLRMQMIKSVNIQLLEKLNKRLPKSTYILIKNAAGYIYQLIVCRIYNQAKGEKWKLSTSINLGDNMVFSHFISQKSEKSKIQSKKKNEEIICQYKKPPAGNAVYDFMLSRKEGTKMQIILVDTILSNSFLSIRKKIFCARGKLQANEAFKKLLQTFAVAKQIEEIELWYYVLSAEDGLKQNTFDFIQENFQKRITEIEKSQDPLNKNELQHLQNLKKNIDSQKISENNLVNFSGKKIKKFKRIAGVLGKDFKINKAGGEQYMQEQKKIIEHLVEMHNKVHQK